MATSPELLAPCCISTSFTIFFSIRLALCSNFYSTRAWDAQRQFLFDHFASGGNSGLILSNPHLLNKLSKLERLEIRLNHIGLQVAREELQQLALRCLPSLRILDVCIDINPIPAIASQGSPLPLEKLVLNKAHFGISADLSVLCEGVLPLLPNLKALEIVSGVATPEQIENHILPAAGQHCPELEMIRFVDHQYGPAHSGLHGPIFKAPFLPKKLKVFAAALDQSVAPQDSVFQTVEALKAFVETLRQLCGDLRELAPNLCCADSPDGSHEPLLTSLIRQEAPIELIKFMLDNGSH